ncbi:hydroxyisourate hydrolase [Silvibacterium sp.]|uniref:hydroxyisourate hydrolase n=1 Tax=Silvibacterium sp. TaxID=1964179 RepID=UPI0039E2A838
MAERLTTLSTHVLDTTLGKPAAGIRVTLDRRHDGHWRHLRAATTDADGRVRELMPAGERLEPGDYRLTFLTGDYHARLGIEGLYPEVSIAFTVRDAVHHHIPLLLTANGYTTYRGS